MQERREVQEKQEGGLVLLSGGVVAGSAPGCHKPNLSGDPS